MSGLAFPKSPNGETRYTEKKERRKLDYAQQQATYRAVDRRDRGRCRACGRRCSVTAVGLLDRAHRHHVIYRSAGGPDETWNVATLCAGCHDAQHNGLLDVRGNADTGLEIWHNGADGWFLDKRELSVHRVERD